MVAPRIQYCKTSDGVNIAYWTMGEGRRLLLSPPLLFSHLTLEWQYPPLRAWYEQLAGHRTVVRWDPRCLGLSTRGAPEPLVGNMLDVEAVLKRVPGEPCDIVAISQPGNGAIEYAAAHPEDVANIVVAEPALRGEFALGRLEVIHALAERDETLWSENVARWVLGWERGRQAHAYAEFILASINREDAQRFFRDNVNFDRTSILPRLTARVLVISNPMADWDRQHAREVAAAIPGAELVEIADTGVRGAFMNVGEASAINEFLGLMPEPPDEITPPSGTAIILFADIVNSTALSEELGDATFRERSGRLGQRVRLHITNHAGTPVEARTLGDGVLSTFLSASDAIAAALDCATAGEEVGLALHLGLHAGDVMRDGGNIYGQAVSIASRVCDLSAPNEVLVSGTVRELARASAGVSFEDRGERELKGVSEPVRVYAVRPTGSGVE